MNTPRPLIPCLMCKAFCDRRRAILRIAYDRILRSIQERGYEWLWVGDEFCTERKLHWIDDLRNKDIGLTLGRFNVFTPDKQLLWTIHWDSHFSFICSSAANLAAIQQTSELEGFLCDPSAEVYWSVRRY